MGSRQAAGSLAGIVSNQQQSPPASGASRLRSSGADEQVQRIKVGQITSLAQSVPDSGRHTPQPGESRADTGEIAHAFQDMELLGGRPGLLHGTTATIKDMPQLHYQSQANNRTAAFNYAYNRMGVSDVHDNLLVRPVQLQEKEDCYKAKVHTAYAQQRAKLQKIDLSNITSSKHNGLAATHAASLPNEIKDYISVPETEDAESRFEISKLGARTGAYGQPDSDPRMFRNKVIKDLSSTKGRLSTNPTNFDSKGEGLRAVHRVRSSTAEAASGQRQPCKRFLARGNNPVAPAYEEHDVVPAVGNTQIAFHHTYIDADGNIRGSPTPSDNRMSLTMQLVPFNALEGKSGAILAQGPSSELLSHGPSRGGQRTAPHQDRAETSADGRGATAAGPGAHQYRQLPQGMPSNLNDFEEEVSGINLGKLFSVYGPSSKQQGRRPRTKGKADTVAHKRISIGELTRGQAAKNVKSQDMAGKPRTQQSGAPGTNAQLPAVGLDGVEPALNQGNHIQLLKSILQEGSFQNIMLQNGQRDAQGKGDDGLVDDDAEEDEDEPTIIKMLESMLPRKLLLSELEAFSNEVSAEELKAEIKNRVLKEVAAKQQRELDDEWATRAVKLDKLLDKIIEKKLQLEAEFAEQKAYESQARQEEEQMQNPFYATLRAQKEERDQFMRLYSSGLIETNSLMPYVVMSARETKQTDGAQDEPTGEDPGAPEPGEAQQDAAGGFDLFEHTRVDLDEKQLEPSTRQDQKPFESKEDTIHSRISGSRGVGTASPSGRVQPATKDIFCFFRLCVDLPKAFFKDLGDTKAVTSLQESEIKDFILQRWPVLTRKRPTWRISFDTTYRDNTFNTVLLGKDAPLSKCCMRSVNI